MNANSLAERFRRVVRVYLTKVVVFFVVGVIVTLIAERVSVSDVASFNESLKRDVRQWSPWQLSRVYYGELFNGGLYSIPGVRLAQRIPLVFFPVTALNIVPASVTTVKRYILNGGTPRLATSASQLPNWTQVDLTTTNQIPGEDHVSPITGLIGIALGVLAVIVFFKYRFQKLSGLGFWVAIFLLSPLAGSILVWIISLFMRLASFALGGVLHEVETPVYVAGGIPLLHELGKAAFKPFEERVVSPIVERATR